MDKLPVQALSQLVKYDSLPAPYQLQKAGGDFQRGERQVGKALGF